MTMHACSVQVDMIALTLLPRDWCTTSTAQARDYEHGSSQLVSSMRSPWCLPVNQHDLWCPK
jgi:hypothetical protein